MSKSRETFEERSRKFKKSLEEEEFKAREGRDILEDQTDREKQKRREGRRSAWRRETSIAPTTFNYNDENKRRAFLKKVMYDIFNYDPTLRVCVPTEIIYDGRREFVIKDVVFSGVNEKTGEVVDLPPAGRPLTTEEDLRYMEKRVYYSSHFYIKVEDPTRLKFSGDPKYFLLTRESLGEELSRIEEIRPTHIKREIDPNSDDKTPKLKHTTLIEDINDLEEEWRKEGFSLNPVEDEPDPDRCRYCGKELEIDPHDAGRYREFCDDECKRKYLRFEKRFKSYYSGKGSPDFDPKKLEVLYRMGILPTELESQFMTTRCRYCGEVISPDKRLGSEFCDDSCKQAFKYRLKNERKIKPDLTSEELVKILRSERTKKRHRGRDLEILERYLRGGGDPHDISPDSWVNYLRSRLEDYDELVVMINNQIKKEQRESQKR